MPALLKVLKDNVPYAYGVMGALWLATAFVTGTPLLAWPTVAFLIGGALLKVQPGKRLTWAWAIATPIMGFLLAGYQAYAAVPLLLGAFSEVAIPSLVLFVVFALGHLLLLYAGNVGSLGKT
jgi:hypothetical protein